MRFLADGMLGRLARWLRVLGHDVLYAPDLDDRALARLARLEGRLLLTRDVALARQRGVPALLITSDRLDDQLLQVARQLRLSLETPGLTRCLACNTPLVAASRDQAAGRVPPYILATQPRLSRCPACQRFYWPGTHWARMQEHLARLRGQLETTCG